MRMRTTLCLILITVPLFAADQTLQQGQASLERGDYAEARRLFEEVATEPDGTHPANVDYSRKSQAYFFLARVEESDPEGSAKRAVANYEKALEMRPSLAAAANNLAQLLLSQGNTARAIELLRSATQTRDPRRPLYLRNLADAFAASGDNASAMKMYLEVLDIHPDDTQAEEGLMRVMDGQGVATYLWQLLDSGKLDRAQKLAVDQLRRDDRDAPVKRDLLGVAAVALARQQATMKMMWQDLSGFADDPNVGEGVRDLRQLYDGSDAQRSSWWGDLRERRAPALSLAEAYGLCAREIAEQFLKAGQRDPAERTLLSGIETAHGEEPDTILALAELYYEEERVDKMDALLSKYEVQLFYGKGRAYARGDLPTIYRFHAALGTIYARLSKNGSENLPKSAIFQLEHARRTANRNNAKPKNEKIYIDPELIDLLAKSYETEKRHAEAQKVRVEAAALYKKEDRTVAMHKVLEPVKVEHLAAPDRKTYDDLVRVTAIKQTSVKKQD